MSSRDDSSLKVESDDDFEDDSKKHIVDTVRCGILDIHTQGNLSKMTATKPVFLTVHDMGSTYRDLVKFVNHPTMRKVKDRSVFLHVQIPGQDFDAPDLPNGYTFPSMDDFAYDMSTVLKFFNIKYCVVIGDGAGANILTRFAMSCPDAVLGCILIHCTSTVAGLMEHFKDTFMNWKLQTSGMNPSAEHYLVYHKFGLQIEQAKNKEKAIKDYVEALKKRINPKNLRLYVDSFLRRTDISTMIREKLKMDVLLVTGSNSSHLHTIHTMHNHMNPSKATLLKLDGVGDVLSEAPERLVYNLVLFCQGLGLLSSYPVSMLSPK